jgi:hypothetical protein
MSPNTGKKVNNQKLTAFHKHRNIQAYFLMNLIPNSAKEVVMTE